MHQAAVITVSYRGDFDLAKELCESVDRFVPREIEHVLIVPRRDRKLFAPLAGGRRRIVLQEDLMPPGSYRIPLPSSIPFVRRHIRDFWWTKYGLLRGWLMQQLVKLSVECATDREIIVFADSDMVFVRPMTLERLVQGDKVRLYRRPGETKDSPTHRMWHRSATRTLSIGEAEYTGADYIAQMVVWRRSVLLKLHFYLQRLHWASWRAAVLKSRNVSEYILYGVYTEHVLKSEGHFFDAEDLVHSSWHYEEMEPFVDDFATHHLAVLIQSTTNLPLAERRRLIERMTSRKRAVEVA